MNIAFAHAGSTKHVRDKARSTPLDLWRPLWALGHTWHNVVVGVQAAALVDLPPNVIDHQTEIRDLLDTRRIVEGCDLVITVDTVLVHLAGTMGKPTWLLVGAVPDRYWGLGTTATPLYPSVTIIRQEVAGEWGPVFETVLTWLTDYEEWERAPESGCMTT